MAYTYDTDSFAEGHMMLGSSKIRTLDSLNYNFKRLTCSEVTASYYDTDRYYFGGIPMLAYKMSNGKSALRIVDALSITGLNGDFENLTENTVLNGCSVEVASNDNNEFILKMQKLSEISSVPTNMSTDYSGMQWLLDEDGSLAIVTTTQQPIAFKKFIFGHKLLLCGEYSDGFSPIAIIEEENGSYSGPSVTSGLILNLDASNPASYAGSGSTWTDLVGSNNATINGATWSSTDGGIFDLDGINDNISIPHSSDLSLSTSTQKTIQVWFKTDTLPSLNQQIPIFGKLSSSFNFDGYWAGLFSNSGVVRSTTNGAAVQKTLDSILTVSTNTWYLLTFMSQITNTSNTTKLYINTTEYISSAHGNDSYLESNPLYLGYIGSGIGSTYFNGKIGACYFYNRGLTAQEVANNYNSTKSRFGL
jgi:hypothetical protein